ncbi:hypothetical protein D3C76_1423730 [compost metagenome]
MAQGDHQTAHHPRIPGPVRQCDGDDDVGQPRPQYAHEEERQNRGRKGHEHIGDAHGELIDSPAEQPGSATNHHPYYQH